jgi:hypothetical protein
VSDIYSGKDEILRFLGNHNRDYHGCPGRL